MAKAAAAPIDVTKYQGVADALNKQLKQSKTAYAPNTTPTASDLNTQLSLMTTQKALDTANTKKMQLDVYGPNVQQSTDLTASAAPKEGLLARTLHALGTPLYALVGGVEAALGKGTKSGLANIPANIAEQGTFGDLLRSYNVNKWAALPIGLAMDIALDPVNWITAGTSATIPKLFTGLKEGGVEGLTAAARSAGLGTADTLASRIPIVNKFVPSALKETLATKAGAAEDVFRTIAGRPSIAAEVSAKSLKPSLGEKIMNFAKAHNIPGIDFFNNKLKYSAGEQWAATIKQDVKETAQTASGQRGTLDDVLHNITMSADPFTAELMNSERARMGNYYKNFAESAATNPPARATLADFHSGDIQNKLASTVTDTNELARVGAEQVRANMDTTGFKWFDNLRQKANASPTVKKLWDTYDWMNGLFKFTKVSANPTSYVNAVIGNATMAGMMGINITDPAYRHMLTQSLKLLNGGVVDAKLAEQIASTPELRDFVTNYSKSAAQLGLNEGLLNRATTLTTLDEFGKEAGTIANKMQGAEAMAKNSPEAQGLIQRLTSFLTSNHFRNLAEGAGDTTVMRDVFSGPFGQTLEQWRSLPEGTRKYVADMAAKASQNYQKIDHTYKIGTMLHASLNGLTEGELRRVSQFIKLAPTDITRAGNLFRLSPLKAGELANEAFMNYAAMPDAVKLLRSMPLLGGPFASFTYAMVTKTAKTLVNNPSLFNKVTFAKNEIARTSPATPLEKSALTGPYYDFLNVYERMKLPFFQSFPTYLNLANWLPYVGLNSFQPSERKYSTAFGQSVGSVMDKLPFLKTPEGQVLFDYVIQPWILGESQPTGMFGQPLFHQSDTALQKTGRAIQTLAQAYVPPWFPPGYRYTQILNALEGKNAQGIPSTKSGYDLTAKALLSTLGAPITDINLTQQATDVKKTLTPAKTTKTTTTKKKAAVPKPPPAIPKP